MRRPRPRSCPRPRLAPRLAAIGCATSLVIAARGSSAAPILAQDAALDARAASFERQDDTFARSECGMNWDAEIKASDRALVEGFFAQSQPFEAYAGRSVFTTIDHFDEHGDQGNFSGIASVGLAAHLVVAKRDGAPAAEIERARAAAVRAARTWHVFATIAGPGSIARGVRRIVPETGSTPLPGTTPDLVPLKGSDGKALPAQKGDTWRAPVASGLSEWIWRDNTSKDQVAGYALGALYLWDALRDDPAVPKGVALDLANDLTRFAKDLMKVGPNGVDLCVLDADGRLTSYGDLNARLVSGSGGFVLAADSALQNGFNAALAMGIVRAAYRVSGDPQLRSYYYDELVAKRQYPKHAVATATLMYQNEGTNFSNVNMLAIALATLGRIEDDPAVRGQLLDLVDKFWDPGGQSRSAKNTQQPWFDVIVAGFGRGAKMEVPDRMKTNLLGISAAPSFQRDRVNCDAGEIAALSCTAVDGSTPLSLASAKGWGGIVVARNVVPHAVRPDTNFLWRSDPFAVNAAGGNRLNPRGDWLAAYWLGRLLDRDPSKNVIARPGAPPAPPGSTSGGTSGASTSPGDDAAGTSGGTSDTSTDGAESGSCRASAHAIGEDDTLHVSAWLGLAGASALAALVRRRRSQRA
ncbi:MAG: hypothetical protein JST00_04980 [Deltaproteobacteria bacterium]|nr:hypothetical protein [Deltaproteobacteria bacterium]